MDFKTYKEIMVDRLSRFFDIDFKYSIKGYNLDLFAVYNERNERYLASKKLTIYSFENDEYVLLKHYPSIDKKSLDDYINMLKDSIEDLVSPHSEHMSSTITGVIVVDNLIDDNIKKYIEKFKYQKGFLFGLKGWVDIRLILVDLQNSNVITCKKCKNISKSYQP